MSIDKFRFVSPGVFTNEIDNSRLARAPDEMGPAIIGRSLRGPLMRPVRVESYSSFTEIFGEPVPGGAGGDVWRDGNKTAPTYGAYAAQAYLRNSGAVTFVRLGGFENDQGQGTAGWKSNNAYGLFVMKVTGSGDVYTTDDTASAPMVAIIYASGSDYGLKGKPLSGSSETAYVLDTWVRASGNDLQFKIKVGGEEKVINFNKDSKKYVRSVLNTNPILTNGNIVDGTAQEDYFLGETFETFANETLGTITGNDYVGILARLKTPGVNGVNFEVFKEGAKAAESGWIVSQHKGAANEFIPNELGEYPVQKLFKLVGLSEGEWNSQNLKISIEDIKAPPNEYVKFGSFTVSIRDIRDNDLTPKYVERFVNVNLDPFSDDYIAKKIGDKYTTWDYEKKEYVEYGTFNNRSKFVRVEMDPDVDNGLTDKDLIPFGFYGPQVITSDVSIGDDSVPADVYFLENQIVGNNAFTASLLLPEIPTLASASQSAASTFSSVYFGFKTNLNKSRKFNHDIVDFVRSQPVSYEKDPQAQVSFLFSLDDLSGSLTGSSVKRTDPVTWKEGNRKDSLSFTAVVDENNLDIGTKAVLSTFNRFSVPLFGGSDGVDITEMDPFNKRVLKSDSNETTNYAYNSVKVAIESISDPEVAEINLAAIPGIDNKGLTDLLIEKCEMRGDALAVIDLEGDYTPYEGRENPDVKSADRKPNVATVIDGIKNRGINSSYGCAFFPWVLVRDTKSNNTVWVPPSVVALGTFSSSQKNTELWFAPAGFNRGGLSEGSAGIPVVQTALRLSSKNRDDLYEANINPIATFPAEGIVIFGQKTLQVTPSALDRINVRRLMIYLKKEISRMAKVVLFDPNVEVTWKRFTNQAVPFLESVQARFGLTDFRVVLDSTTTTPELVDRNIVYAKIMLKPARAIEFIALDFVIAPTGASFED